VVQRREVGQLDHQRRRNNPCGMWVAELGCEDDQQRTKSLAAGVEQVPSSFVDEVDLGGDRASQLLLDLQKLRPDTRLQVRVDERQTQGSRGHDQVPLSE